MPALMEDGLASIDARLESDSLYAIPCGGCRVWEQTYEMPDVNFVTTGGGRFRCPGVRFLPSLVGKEASGIHVTAFLCIMECDVGICNDLYANVVLFGGTTIFTGFGECKVHELTALALSSMKIKVTTPP